MAALLARLFAGVDVGGIIAEIDAHPELWNSRGSRVASPASPHHGVDDIWLRYRALSELTNGAAFRELHESVDYPDMDLLPSIRPLLDGLREIGRCYRNADRVDQGGVLITRIPPGGSVKWHHDRGSWHAEHYETKLYVPLLANPQCVNFVGDESGIMNQGDVWFFNNQVDHAVFNWGATPRVTLISCLHCVKGRKV